MGPGITLANWLVHVKEFMGHTNTCIFRAELAPGPQNMKKDIGDIIACTDKKILIYKEIQSGSVAKSYMRKGFLIYVEIFPHL